MQLSKSEEIRTEFKSLRKNLSQKEMEERHITKQYKSIANKLDELQKKWDEKTKKFDNLVENVKLWKSGKPLPGD
jgi:chromosome segregation ATPase